MYGQIEFDAQEHELDLLLIYFELLSDDIPKESARLFYQEMVCMSRSHIVTKRGPKNTIVWNVCFANDYSDIIGTLLADIVSRTIALQDPSLDEAARYMEESTVRMGSPFFDIMASKSIRAGFYLGDSCCKQCKIRSYFPYLSPNTCRNNPFGKNCCHKSCKSLSRLRMGMAIAVKPCCMKLKPQKCKLI
jgi:hypothetical protein